MENALMEANGLNARVLLFRDTVRIKAVGLRNVLSGATKVEKEFLVSQIVGLEFKKAGLFANGYIEFELQRWHEKSDRDSEHGVEDIVILFKPGQQKAFEAFREMLVANMTSAGGAAKAPSPATTDLDQLDKLASLRDRGIITEEEFGRKKKQLLGL